MDLEAVKRRHNRYESLRTGPINTPQLAAAAATAADVPGLVAEVERVRATLARAWGYLSRVETRTREDRDRLVFACDQIQSLLGAVPSGEQKGGEEG